LPRWRGDGREIFFIDGRGRLSAVSVKTDPRVEIGTPAPLFDVATETVQGFPYDVTPSGQEFIVLRLRNAASVVRLTVAVDWMAAQ
jgi:hypothetical protein